MSKGKLTRRDFNKLSMAALGGAMAGAMTGCDEKKPAPAPAPAPTGGGAATHETKLLMDEPHVCRGLNTCSGDDNACAGQGASASVMAHACNSKNECKGEGGCGENPGANACKSQGECAVPLSDKAWTTARKNFESAMKDAGKKFGDAPAKS